MNTTSTSASFLATVVPVADSIRTNNHLYVVRKQSAASDTDASRLFAFLFEVHASSKQKTEKAAAMNNNGPDYYSSYE